MTDEHGCEAALWIQVGREGAAARLGSPVGDVEGEGSLRRAALVDGNHEDFCTHRVDLRGKR